VDGKLYVLGARDVSVPLPQVQEIPERAFANLVHECRNHFDLIIVDSPAILSSVGGSVPFIESADRALMIVEWQQTERQAVREALDTLGSHATKVIGIILNKVPLHWHRLFNNGRYRDYAYSQSDRTEVQTVSPRRIGTADRTASNGMS
jgi:Mrp family chromosome partitioning ATPase